MAKKKKKVEPIVPAVPRRITGQWYWCVHCGYHGDFGFHRKNNAKCGECDTPAEDLAFFTLEEINDEWLDNIWLERFVKNSKDKGGTLAEKLAKIKKL